METTDSTSLVELQREDSMLDAVFSLTRDLITQEEEDYVREYIGLRYSGRMEKTDIFGHDILERVVSTALIAIEEIGLKRDGVLAILLFRFVDTDSEVTSELRDRLGAGVADIISGISKVHSLYEKTPRISSENFRNLLLSFAEDMRVILIMIADRVSLMRSLKNCTNEVAVRRASEEASYLYAPLAHKLGLYMVVQFLH